MINYFKDSSIKQQNILTHKVNRRKIPSFLFIDHDENERKLQSVKLNIIIIQQHVYITVFHTRKSWVSLSLSLFLFLSKCVHSRCSNLMRNDLFLSHYYYVCCCWSFYIFVVYIYRDTGKLCFLWKEFNKLFCYDNVFYFDPLGMFGVWSNCHTC